CMRQAYYTSSINENLGERGQPEPRYFSEMKSLSSGACPLFLPLFLKARKDGPRVPEGMGQKVVRSCLFARRGKRIFDHASPQSNWFPFISPRVVVPRRIERIARCANACS